MLLSWVLLAQLGCPADLETWATQMTTQLPRYTNLVFVRSGNDYRLTRVGIPEWELLDGDRARIWFMTAERDATASLNRAYQLDVQQTTRGWELLQLRVAQDGTLAPRDASYGAVAQAIAQWQTDHCPSGFEIGS